MSIKYNRYIFNVFFPYFTVLYSTKCIQSRTEVYLTKKTVMRKFMIDNSKKCGYRVWPTYYRSFSCKQLVIKEIDECKGVEYISITWNVDSIKNTQSGWEAARQMHHKWWWKVMQIYAILHVIAIAKICQIKNFGVYLILRKQIKQLLYLGQYISLSKH